MTTFHALPAFSKPSTCQKVKLALPSNASTESALRKNHENHQQPGRNQQRMPKLATAEESMAAPLSRAACITASACSFAT